MKPTIRRRPAPVIIKNREIREEKQYNKCPIFIKTEINMGNDDENVIITRTCTGGGIVVFSALGQTIIINKSLDTVELCDFNFYDSYEEYSKPESTILYLDEMTKKQAKDLIQMLSNDIIYATKISLELREASSRFKEVKCRMNFNSETGEVNTIVKTPKFTKEYKLENHKKYRFVIDDLLKEKKEL